MCGELDNRGYSAEAQEFREAIAEISALRAAQVGAGDGAGWKPIETAPKCGKRIIGWVPGWEYARCYAFVTAGGEPFGWRNEAGRVMEHEQPTHWLPWPEPPPAVGADVGTGTDLPASAS
jgi:hypothetical protein